MTKNEMQAIENCIMNLAKGAWENAKTESVYAIGADDYSLVDQKKYLESKGLDPDDATDESVRYLQLSVGGTLVYDSKSLYDELVNLRVWPDDMPKELEPLRKEWTDGELEYTIFIDNTKKGADVFSTYGFERRDEDALAVAHDYKKRYKDASITLCRGHYTWGEDIPLIDWIIDL